MKDRQVEEASFSLERICAAAAHRPLTKPESAFYVAASDWLYRRAMIEMIPQEHRK